MEGDEVTGLDIAVGTGGPHQKGRLLPKVLCHLLHLLLGQTVGVQGDGAGVASPLLGLKHNGVKGFCHKLIS